eukprot:CAMPEP_0197416856 /NCGR_PEP_ID=MMETSP1170-20131217/3060_1 /TAXON_ID=54406 /ORGANISM="Sarcinochrysis sp, Strain CCMP770" /LENGTH=134 /DNA_ID=CAMNT_0042943787 /DNA_START=21 /DNA_END=425 /DNA_ORIENTATION=-
MSALRCYRSMLRVAAGMQPHQREAVKAQARKEIEFFRDVKDPAEITRLVKLFEDKIAYARMTTTRHPTSNVTQPGRTRIIYGKNGEKLDVGTPRDKAKYTNWDGSNLDPDSVKRHYRGLNRCGFRDNAHAKGMF